MVNSMKKKIIKSFLLYGLFLLLMKVYLRDLFPITLFIDWKTCSQSLLLAFIFFLIKILKLFLIFEFLNFLICIDQMISLRIKHKNMLIWISGILLSILLISLDLIFVLPEVKYGFYLFFDVIYLSLFIGYQIFTLSKKNIKHFYIGLILYISLAITINSIICI